MSQATDHRSVFIPQGARASERLGAQLVNGGNYPLGNRKKVVQRGGFQEMRESLYGSRAKWLLRSK